MTTENNENKTPEEIEAEAKAKDEARVAALIEERTQENLKKIKTQLDSAFAQRDELQKKLAEKELAEAEAKKARLAEEGKYKELYELQLSEEKAKNDALAKRNTELSRDVELRSALAGKDFKNDRTANIAFKEIVSELVQLESGVWQHKSGVSIAAHVEAFCTSEENAFLLKVKANSGSGTGGNTSGNTTGETGKKKSLFAMSQADVLRLAEEGKL